MFKMLLDYLKYTGDIYGSDVDQVRVLRVEESGMGNVLDVYCYVKTPFGNVHREEAYEVRHIELMTWIYSQALIKD